MKKTMLICCCTLCVSNIFGYVYEFNSHYFRDNTGKKSLDGKTFWIDRADFVKDIYKKHNISSIVSGSIESRKEHYKKVYKGVMSAKSFNELLADTFGTVSCNGEEALTSFKKATSIAILASLISIDVVNNNDYNSLLQKKCDFPLQDELDKLRIEGIRSSIKGIISSDVFKNEVLKNIISSNEAITAFLKDVNDGGVTYATGVLFLKFLLREKFTLQSLSSWKLLGELLHNNAKSLILNEITNICNEQHTNTIKDEVIKCIRWAFGVCEWHMPKNLAIGLSNQALLSCPLAEQNMSLFRSNNPSVASQEMQMSNVLPNINSSVRRTLDFAYNNWDINDFYEKIGEVFSGVTQYSWKNVFGIDDSVAPLDDITLLVSSVSKCGDNSCTCSLGINRSNFACQDTAIKHIRNLYNSEKSRYEYTGHGDVYSSCYNSGSNVFSQDNIKSIKKSIKSAKYPRNLTGSVSKEELVFAKDVSVPRYFFEFDDTKKSVQILETTQIAGSNSPCRNGLNASCLLRSEKNIKEFNIPETIELIHEAALPNGVNVVNLCGRAQKIKIVPSRQTSIFMPGRESCVKYKCKQGSVTLVVKGLQDAMQILKNNDWENALPDRIKIEVDGNSDYSYLTDVCVPKGVKLACRYVKQISDAKAIIKFDTLDMFLDGQGLDVSKLFISEIIQGKIKVDEGSMKNESIILGGDGIYKGLDCGYQLNEQVVFIPHFVTRVSKGAFSENQNLTGFTLDIPDNTRLETIEISEILKIVPSYAFTYVSINFKIPRQNKWKFVGTKDEFCALYNKKGKIEFSDSKNADEEFDRILKESFAAQYPGEDIGDVIPAFKKKEPEIVGKVVYAGNISGDCKKSRKSRNNESGQKSIKKSDAYNEYEGDHALNPLDIINAQKKQNK